MKKALLHFGLTAATIMSHAQEAPTPRTGPDLSQFALTLFVAPGGNDQNNGTLEHPLATPEAARDHIRALKDAGDLPGGRIVVFLRGGRYPVSQTIRFAERDSGSAESPVIYAAYEGEEVRLSGGARLNPREFAPVTDPEVLNRLPAEARAHVRMLDLSNRDVDFGSIPFRGHSLFRKTWLPGGPEAPELFVNQEPMTPARWPNEGFVTFPRVPEPGSRPRDGAKPPDPGYRTPVLGYNDPRPERWKHAEDAWLFGYWGNEWSDQTIQLESVSAENKSINLRQASTYGVMRKHRFFIFNLLEEIDRPGEWYLDRQSGILYLYPPRGFEQADVVLSQMSEPMILLDSVSHMALRGLTFEHGRGLAVNIRSGEHNTLYACAVRNFARDGIHVNGGQNHTVHSCHIHNIGATGIRLEGGDRESLSPAGHLAENNHIHAFARLRRTYSPAVAVTGVGNRLAHNEIHNAPHMGVSFSGNNHLLEYNIIHNIATETGDVGGMYGGRDWTSRGTVIRHNLFHSVAGMDGGHGAFPVYFDDGLSGNLVFGNIFHGTYDRAVLIGNGHHNRVINNIFVECKIPVRVDLRFKTWARHMLPNLFSGLEKVVNRPVWLREYPELEGILDRDPDLSTAQKNVITHNVLYKSGGIEIANDARPHNQEEHNLSTNRDPGFRNPAAFDFAIPEHSWIYRELPGFRPIPFDRIGRYGMRPHQR
ncbi:MAG: right-handed parallel beta-helix repeat-containing protein [Verrucomicrobia bacterium]|nr:right-handed parallel beta-helix repeat-containing protein [Verrucomicrobiota bacterium]MCH8526974.1 right-handed parallel beta-helix repeat-containing protein [Kiritimatiellia bacterium]